MECRNSNKIKVLTIVCLILFISCAAQNKVQNIQNSDTIKPEWVFSPTKAYPQSQYVAYVGVGSTKASSEREAANGIASVFKTKIKSTSDYHKTVNESSNSYSSNMTLDNNISTSTDIELINIKITNSYYDKADDKYYSLATIHKMSTSSIYRNKVNKLFEENNVLNKNLSSESDEVSKIGIVGAMLTNIYTIDEYCSILEVLDHRYLGASEYLTKPQIEKLKSDILNKVLVYIEYDETINRAVLKSVKKEFSNLGLKITDDKSKSMLIANLSLSMKETKLDNVQGLFMSWNILINISNSETQNQICIYNSKGRSSQLNKDALVERTQYDITLKLKNEFNSFITQNLYKQ